MNRCTSIVPSLLILMLGPLPAWACSGPGAQEAIQWNTRASLLLFLAAVAATVLTVFLRRRWKRPRKSAARVVVPVALHPGWWMSSLSGDCGITRFHAAMVVTGCRAASLLLHAAAYPRGSAEPH